MDDIEKFIQSQRELCTEEMHRLDYLRKELPHLNEYEKVRSLPRIQPQNVATTVDRELTLQQEYQDLKNRSQQSSGTVGFPLNTRDDEKRRLQQTFEASKGHSFGGYEKRRQKFSEDQRRSYNEYLQLKTQDPKMVRMGEYSPNNYQNYSLYIPDTYGTLGAHDSLLKQIKEERQMAMATIPQQLNAGSQTSLPVRIDYDKLLYEKKLQEQRYRSSLADPVAYDYNPDPYHYYTNSYPRRDESTQSLPQTALYPYHIGEELEAYAEDDRKSFSAPQQVPQRLGVVEYSATGLPLPKSGRQGGNGKV